MSDKKQWVVGERVTVRGEILAIGEKKAECGCDLVTVRVSGYNTYVFPESLTVDETPTRLFRIGQRDIEVKQ